MFAHDFYEQMGNHFFSLATSSGHTGILPAVKKCFVIAAQNLKNIISVVQDSDKKSQLLGQFNKTLGFAEEI